MKKILVMIAVASTMILLFASVSMATFINPVSWDGPGKELQAVLDGLLVTPPPPSLVNASGAVNDALANDAIWAVQSSGGAVSTFIIQLTAYSPTESFGIFDATNAAKKVQLFAGGAVPGSQTLLGIFLDGSIFINNVDTGIDFAGNAFGFYLGGAGANTFYSVDSLNIDGNDHMVAFRGNGKNIQLPNHLPGIFSPDEYILAFEDLPWNNANWNGAPGTDSDRDYNDTVVLVESINTIPEPGILILLGIGLSAVGILSRRIKL